MNPEELEQAFQLFSQASAQLAGAYQDLQQQVERLTEELAVANGELRRQLEEKAALSQRLGLLLEALPAGVVVLDEGGTVVQANSGAAAMFGEDLVGRSWPVIAGQCLLETSMPQEWDLMGERQESPRRRVSIGTRALAPAEGQILFVHDVTESRQMQQQFERHRRLSAMGEMAASLAHQLRTPLATALLYTAHLTRPILADGERLRFAEKSLARLRHLERLIQDMLLFVKGESAPQEPIVVSSILAELQQVMEPQMAERGMAFQVVDQSEGSVVLGTRKALTGAMLNLLENGMQACAEGDGVALHAECEDVWLILRVVDSGRGIDASHQERLFEPFFTTRTEGTGLGLAIVRSVIEGHGGQISVVSEPGHGTEFVIRLPIHSG